MEQIGNDMHGSPLYVGDTVYLEQCWEDQAGNYHDEYVEVAGINPDGTLKFRIGHFLTRKKRDQELQAYLNKCEWYPKDVQKEPNPPTKGK